MDVETKVYLNVRAKTGVDVETEVYLDVRAKTGVDVETPSEGEDN